MCFFKNILLHCFLLLQFYLRDEEMPNLCYEIDILGQEEHDPHMKLRVHEFDSRFSDFCRAGILSLTD